MKKKKILLIVLVGIIAYLVQGMVITGIFYWMYSGAKVEVNTDITKYNDYIGERAKEEYRSKWDMDESIFPNKITNDMNVIEYEMVYYNPWDAQYLSYLIVKYNDEDYDNELDRLTNYDSTNYKGYYGVTGFSNYNLLAINADSYYGFIYALDLGDNKIIYVEIIFCNYFMDLDYKKYIDKKYLPDEFDAKVDNKYMKKMIK